LRWVDTFAHALGQSEVNETRHLVFLGFADEFQKELASGFFGQDGENRFQGFSQFVHAFSGSIRLTIARISSMMFI